MPPDTAEQGTPRQPPRPGQSGARYTPGRKKNPFVRSTQGGRVLSAMMLPLLLAWPPRTYGVITTTGRRTGKARRKCVRVVRQENRAYLVAIPGERAAWLKNIRANPNVVLQLRGGTFRGIARDPRDAEEQARAREIFCATLAPFDHVAGALHEPGRPSKQKLEALHGKWFDIGTPLVVEIEPTR
jgi:deazaflavin-dependent oxidoreductase (nitroreductase family)